MYKQFSITYHFVECGRQRREKRRRYNQNGKIFCVPNKELISISLSDEGKG